MSLITLTILTSFTEVLCARDPPTITLAQGQVMGTFQTLYRTQRIVAFLGIPYAMPPTGINRFRPPVFHEIPNWEGVRNASLPTPDCMQSDPVGEHAKHPYRRHDLLFAKLLQSQLEPGTLERFIDEDCLYLNVYVPDVPAPSDGFATMVWIHGGEFVRGSPHDINPFQLVFKQQVIVITMAYRLNIFGFFTTMDGESPGNFGLMDQAAALDWVKHNTEAFGGNQDNICIFGQGSGGVSVGLHLTSGVWSTKSFHKAIIMSGNSLAPNVVKIPKRETATIDAVASAFSCFRKPTSALISCLRNVQPQALLDQGDPIAEWGPIIDNGLSNTTRPFIPDYPMQLFEKGLYEKVPILSGYTNMEEALILIKDDNENAGISQSEFDSMITDLILIDIVTDDDNTTCYTNQQHIFDTVGFMFKPLPPTKNETILRKLFLDFYTEKKYGSPTYLLGQYMHPHAPVFVYRFDLKPISEPPNENIPGWVGIAHNFDLTFAWGLPYLALPQDFGKWQSSDKRVSDIIMKMWANFALYSNPTNSGVFITWEPFTMEEPHFLIINRTFNMSTAMTMNYKAFEFWNDFYPKVIEIGTQCCNETESNAVCQHVFKFSAIWLFAFVIIPFIQVYTNSELFLDK